MWKAGIYSGSSASPTIINCTIINNSGSGIYNDYGSSPKIVNCVIADNEGFFHGGGMNNFESTPTVINCVFSGNTGYSGGGIHNNDSYPTLISARTAIALKAATLKNVRVISEFVQKLRQLADFVYYVLCCGVWHIGDFGVYAGGAD